MYQEEYLEDGIVKEVHAGMALIGLLGSENCDSCCARQLCALDETEGRNLTAVDLIGVRPGDHVRVSVGGRDVLAATIMLYGIPLFLFLFGIAVGMQLFTALRELWSSLLGVGLIGIYGIAMFFRSRVDRGSKPIGRIVAVFPFGKN